LCGVTKCSERGKGFLSARPPAADSYQHQLESSNLNVHNAIERFEPALLEPEKLAVGFTGSETPCEDHREVSVWIL
jgi:hypothetical protein